MGKRRNAGRVPARRAKLLVIAVLCATSGAGAALTPEPAAAGASFSDIAGSIFEDDIEWAAAEGITTGCTATEFCPNDPVTRGQMAAFLVRMFDLPATANDYFSDDETSTFEDSINRVTRAGIAKGCTETRFCPTRPVRRGEMATFIARAAGLTSGGTTNFFYDDNGTTHEISTNRAAYAGIATGCSLFAFCPTNSVTRGQMAAFLHRVVEPVARPPSPAPPPEEVPWSWFEPSGGAGVFLPLFMEIQAGTTGVVHLANLPAPAECSLSVTFPDASTFDAGTVIAGWRGPLPFGNAGFEAIWEVPVPAEMPVGTGDLHGVCTFEGIERLNLIESFDVTAP